MTPEAQRLAIAKVCGWEPCAPRSHGSLRAPAYAFMKDGAYYGGLNALPRYTEDLNAMYEAEDTFPHPSDFYLFTLANVCGGYDRIYRATASQRAEAFLKAFGLWTD